MTSPWPDACCLCAPEARTTGPISEFPQPWNLSCARLCVPFTWSPGAWISSFAFCTPAPSNLSGTDACGIHYSPVLADTDQYSACISLARCTASASACSHAAPDWKKQPWLTRYLGPPCRGSLGWPPLPTPASHFTPSKQVWWGIPGQGCCLPRADTVCSPREVSDPCLLGENPLQSHNP